MRQEGDRNEQQWRGNADERRARMQQPDVGQDDGGKPKRLRQCLPMAQEPHPLPHEFYDM